MALSWTEAPAPGSEIRSYEARDSAQVWLRTIAGSNGKFRIKGSVIMPDGTAESLWAEYDTADDAKAAGEAWWEGLVPPP